MSTTKKTSILENKFSNFMFVYSPPVLWALLIFIFSSQQLLPSVEFSALDFVLKKTAHIFVYAVLYLLLFRTVNKSLTRQRASKLKNNSRLLYLPILICLVYAVSDEIHQYFVPGRFATLRDVGFDMLGVGIAFLKKYKYI
ncbi:MAG: VanZ family protein [Patescibacteria group bacterium]